MNITVVGTGYVGLVTGACFADYPEPDFAEEHPEEAWRLNVGTVRTFPDPLS